jgi:hypothetical protein
MVMPTPTAGPLMAAIEGFRQLKIASTKRPPREPELAKTPAPWVPDVSKLLAPPAGHDNRADIVVDIGARERIGDLRPHQAGIGIELFGAVERDDHERAVEIARDVFVDQDGPQFSLFVRLQGSIPSPSPENNRQDRACDDRDRAELALARQQWHIAGDPDIRAGREKWPV